MEILQDHSRHTRPSPSPLFFQRRRGTSPRPGGTWSCYRCPLCGPSDLRSGPGPDNKGDGKFLAPKFYRRRRFFFYFRSNMDFFFNPGLSTMAKEDP